MKEIWFNGLLAATVDEEGEVRLHHSLAELKE